MDYTEVLQKFGMFLIAGGIGFLFDVLISTQLLKTKKMKLLVANTIGFLVGVVIKYYINRIWTFNSQDPNVLMQFLKFMGISLIGLGIVNVIVYYLHHRKGKKFIVSKVMSMSVFMIWNFVANYWLTFTN
jgi:putative flippase GtrA